MGLGGLAETGKNTYIIEVDDSIYIFDCGLKFATENLYGIDYIIPDFEYLVKSKKRIKGLFLTHGHYENMGATADLLRLIPNLKVYATKFTKYILEQDGVNPNNIIEIKSSLDKLSTPYFNNLSLGRSLLGMSFIFILHLHNFP